MKSLIGEDVLDELTQTAARSPQGSIVEVGVYQGGSALRLYQVAREQNRQLYLYDTFEGLPFKDEIDVLPVGEFRGSYHAVKYAFPEAIVVKGIFPGSAVPDMAPVAFAHLDCDQYRSVKESTLYLLPFMVPGGIIWFDDYGGLAGATQAVHDIFPEPKYSLIQAKCGKTYYQVPLKK